jgi:hypothetical protein
VQTLARGKFTLPFAVPPSISTPPATLRHPGSLPSPYQASNLSPARTLCFPALDALQLDVNDDAKLFRERKSTVLE